MRSLSLNIFKAQPEKLDKRDQTLTKQAFTPHIYKSLHLKFNWVDFHSFGMPAACLLHFLENSFVHKKMQDGTRLVFVDYSAQKISHLLGGAFGQYEVKTALRKLHQAKIIKWGSQGAGKLRRRGRQIFRGKNYRTELKSLETGIINIYTIKEHGVNSAIIESIVKSHCRHYSRNFKKRPDATTVYDIASTQQINKIVGQHLTPDQIKKARAKLIKSGLLFKSRSRNLQTGKQRCNSWVYSSNSEALEKYKRSKCAHYVYSDAELFRQNDIGMSLLESDQFFRSKNDHSARYQTPRYDLEFNLYNSDHRDELVENDLINLNYFEQKIVNKRNNQHVNYESGEIPTRKKVFEIVKKFKGSSEQAESIFNYWNSRNWRINGKVCRNFVGLIRNAVKRSSNFDPSPAWLQVEKPSNPTRATKATPERYVKKKERKELLDLCKNFKSLNHPNL